MPRSTIRKLNRLFEPICAAGVITLLVISGFVTLHSLTRMWQDVDKVGGSYAVLETLDSLSIALREAEGYQRGFLVTGDDSYLDRYMAAEASLDDLLSELTQRTANNPSQDEVLDSLKQSIRIKREELSFTIKLRQEGSQADADVVARTNFGKDLMAQIRDEAELMRGNARVRYAMQLAETKHTYQTAWLTGLLLTLSALALVGGVLWAVYRQRRLKEKNRKLDEQIRLFLEQISDYAIFMMDTECRATTWNDGVKQVLGFDELEFLDRDVRPLIFTPEAHASGVVDAEFERATKNGAASDDRWMKRKDDTQFWASGITSSIRNASGKVVGFSKVMRDMTEQKQNSDELSRLAAELSEESRRKNEFLATLAHELRNPLSPIKSAVQLMSLMDVSPEIHDLRATMEVQVEQIVRLLDDLMDVSRIGRGKIDLKKQVVEISTVIDAAVDNAQSHVEANSQQLSVRVAPSGLCVDVDPARITQVICNLINNASKYSDVDCKIDVSAERVDEFVVITVTDNGSGISPERIDDIFEMFAQIEDSVERGVAGLGIGLTLVRTLVELHGGTVAAASDGIGKGSEFTIRLPAAIAPEVQEAVPAKAPHNVRPMKVLVVDDMRALSVILSRLLTKLGHDVRIVDSGTAALEVLQTFPADVVFSDISMPGMTGYELAKQLRKDHRHRDMKLVAMTGYGQASDRQKALSAGFDEHMVKPVDFKVLQAFFQGDD
ncbi:hybrid sensor histidine kinase/response regulator [Allorhodopirellula heiligendammensis]|uniref:histidine kinase n=1 Tax=Allorhodopirellula heiligendammensis TaxID=2714739 RepID=A0A5C6CB23_9BACT|nr:CHASE3 domain-containing protein [Allorhodopirellula heiligendammensis]TWU20019.1 Aerobic respiration control sensor protein ArcB [Allorhodopirellula heiligendammensis]